MDSSLRPRDIQNRIRSGQTPEAVAQVAGTTVERIMAFATPVLAERAHAAQRAQGSSVRRRPSEGGGTPTAARTLGDAVAARLRTLDVDPDSVGWDAWRRDDGRWALSATYETPERAGEGTFVFDAPGNYVQLEDDDARWLVGEALPTQPAPTRDDLSDARARRGRVSLVDEELPLGEDAIGMVSTEPFEDLGAADEADAPEAERRAPVQEQLALTGEPAQAEEATVDLTETARRVRGDHPTASTVPDGESADDAPEEPAAPQPRRPRKGRGRPSVPSWDEIMFGSASSD